MWDMRIDIRQVYTCPIVVNMKALSSSNTEGCLIGVDL